MTEMRKQRVPFTDVVNNFVEIIAGAMIAAIILSYGFKMDLNKPGTLGGVIAGSVAGFVACRTKRDD